MTVEALVIWLIVGAVAGYLASIIMKGKGLGLTGNDLVDYVILGVIGAFVGGWVLGLLGLAIGGGLVGSIISALFGSCLFILVVRAIKRV